MLFCWFRNKEIRVDQFGHVVWMVTACGILVFACIKWFSVHCQNTTAKPKKIHPSVGVAVVALGAIVWEVLNMVLSDGTFGSSDLPPEPQIKIILRAIAYFGGTVVSLSPIGTILCMSVTCQFKIGQF
jgi:hypothetical protein